MLKVCPFFLLLACTPLSAQLLNWGVKGGVPLNDAVKATGTYKPEFHRWTLGPTVDLNLPAGLGIERIDKPALLRCARHELRDALRPGAAYHIGPERAFLPDEAGEQGGGQPLLRRRRIDEPADGVIHGLAAGRLSAGRRREREQDHEAASCVMQGGPHVRARLRGGDCPAPSPWP